MSFKSVIENVPPGEVRQFLETNADFVHDDQTYIRALTEDELADIEHELGDNSVKLAMFERQKKDYLERMREQTKPLQDRNKAIVESLRTKFEEVEGTVYEFKDVENGTIEQFTAEGQFIASRRMRPDENDGNVNILRMSRRTGTDD